MKLVCVSLHYAAEQIIRSERQKRKWSLAYLCCLSSLFGHGGTAVRALQFTFPFSKESALDPEALGSTYSLYSNFCS